MSASDRAGAAAAAGVAAVSLCPNDASSQLDWILAASRQLG
jgi:hypothetical protein